MRIFTTRRGRHPSAPRPDRRRLRGPAAILTAAVLAATGLTGAGTILAVAPAGPAQAAAGNPGTPSDPTTIYTEDFENGQSDGQTPLEDYVGAAPTNSTYTADEAWLTNCNGEIIEYNTPYTDLGNCNDTADTGHTRQLAYALGKLTGDATPETNHAVTAYTATAPGANLTEFETVNPIPLASATGRFVTFSVDAAAVNCQVAQPEYNFSLTSSGTTTPVGGTINACSSGTTVNAPASGPVAAEAINVGTYTSDGAVLVTGSSIGITMKNADGDKDGNDAAFDNIKIIDETPQLDKSFSPTSIETGGTSTLTFTVTNTSELAAKDGWSFTDALPSGLTVADPAATGGTCDATTTAPAGSDSIAVTDGNLAAGETSCTITVNVTSDTAGSYTNGPDNVTTTGLNPPGKTTVNVTDPSYTVEKKASESVTHPGDKVTYTVTVKNTGKWAYDDSAADPFKQASFTDDLSSVLDDATYDDDASGGATVSENTLSWSGDLAVGATKTITYSVTVNDPDKGDQKLDNSVTTPGDNGGACASDTDCATDTPLQSYTVAKKASTATVAPGGKVTYTVTVANTGKTAYTTAAPATFTDDLSKVTDDATYNNDATNGATVSGNTLSWSGALAVGETKTITYSVTVNNPDKGDGKLDNTVVAPHDNGGSCATTDGCSTDTPVKSYTVAKKASNVTVSAGKKVTYAVTVANTGKTAYTTAAPATFTDDLSKVTDDATYNNDATNGATVSGNTLSWSGALAVGETKTITYSVTVNNPDKGDHKLVNAVVAPATDGGSCASTGGCITHTAVTDPSAGPAVATGGSATTQAPVLPWIGAGALGLALLIGLGMMRVRRNQHGLQDGRD